ncbi:hypothetical protein B0H13DRAFT_2264091 [Mycena leptocephala]|nr:hypothetical protein B0H13DRAFT_2264091 [Mycena leptocephala]
MHSFLSLSSTPISSSGHSSIQNHPLSMATGFQETRAAALENCRDFTIQGGTFNVSSTTMEESLGNFRIVKLGDLNLLDEIGKYNVVEQRPVHHRRTGAVVRHVKVIVGTRRVYRARIFGSQDSMTAVVYNDAQFEQASTISIEWVKCRKAHNCGRQLCLLFFGFTSSASLNALIYHDEMIPFSQVQKLHAGSTLASYYFINETTRHYFIFTGNKPLEATPFSFQVPRGSDCPPGNYIVRPGVHSKLPEVKLTENDLGDKLLSTLELDEFYSLLVYNHTRWLRWASSTPETIVLPSIRNPSCDPAHFKPNDLHAFPTEKHLTLDDSDISPWYTNDLPQEVLPTGWTRVDYSESHSFWFSATVGLKDYIAPMKWWLSQNHYVRNHLQGVFNATEFITSIRFFCNLNAHLDFTLRGTFMADAPTDKVYLFLFPLQVDVVNNLLTVTNPPDTEKYYWAFDPVGLNRLTHETVEDFGLPAVEFSIGLMGRRWEESDYDMIRDFHVAKRFDPDTQDTAIAMGYPLIDIEKMKKFIPGFAGESSMDGSDAEIDDGIYYSLGLC